MGGGGGVAGGLWGEGGGVQSTSGRQPALTMVLPQLRSALSVCLSFIFVSLFLLLSF